MAIKVKTAAESASKLVSRAQAASGEYSVQAQASGQEWASKTQAAKNAFQQGITAGGLADRWVRGVAKAGADKYVRKVRDVGAGRFSSGVAAGQTDYVTNVEPFLATIAGLDLGSRGPRGSAENYQRVEKIGKALNAKRMALLGVSVGA